MRARNINRDCDISYLLFIGNPNWIGAYARACECAPFRRMISCAASVRRFDRWIVSILAILSPWHRLSFPHLLPHLLLCERSNLSRRNRDFLWIRYRSSRETAHCRCWNPAWENAKRHGPGKLSADPVSWHTRDWTLYGTVRRYARYAAFKIT